MINSRFFCILTANCDTGVVYVISLNVRVDIINDQIIGFIPGIIPELTWKQMLPFLCREFPVHARSNVRSHHRRLYGKSPAPAERIDQYAVTFPRCEHDQSGSQVFRDRSLIVKHSVASLVKALPAGVDTDHYLIFIQEYPHGIIVSVFHEHFPMIGVLHPLDHGLFHDRLDVSGRKKCGLDGRNLRYPESGILRQILLPGYRSGTRKKLLIGRRIELSDLQQNSLCGSQKYIGSGQSIGTARKADATVL